MDIATLAYTAGIIDGEGSIKIIKMSPTGSTYMLELSVQVADLVLMEWLKKHWGGSIHSVKPTVATHSTQFGITWNAATAQNILVNTLPFLVIKKDQAELAILFQDLRHPRGRRIKSAAELIVDMAIYDGMKKLHSRNQPVRKNIK